MTAAQIHQAETANVHALLHTSPDGLSAAEAARRRAELGPNSLDTTPPHRWTRLLARQLTHFFSLLLDVSAALCFVAERLQPGEGMAMLGWALLAVSLLNAGFGFLQAWRAERAMEALRRLLPQRVAVRRDGREVELDAEDLVPGDVLVVAEGQRAPADARVVEGRGLLVDNAPLTGESRPIGLDPRPVAGPITEATNVLFAGCLVLRGAGEAVVFATGRRTEFGRIATLSAGVRRPPSPLERETRRLVRIVTTIATTMGLAFFVYGVATGRPLWVNVMFMLGIIVANVPEGLLPTMTLSLALGAVRLAKRNVLVRSLNAVESLGAVQVICTDKTGTLTLNRLAVTRVVDGLRGHELGEAPRRALLQAAVVACDLHEREGRLTGDPLDVAVAEACDRHGSALDVVRRTPWRFPFDVRKRRAAGARPEGDVRRFAVKGAWEALRPALARIDAADGETAPADEGALAAVDATVRRLASQGYRVLAVASRTFTGAPDAAALERGLTLHGLLCLEDPLRREVPAAMAKCREAGIRVLMITGDHPDTAVAVARRAGLLADGVGPATVVHGDDLERMREREVAERLRGGAAIFARTTPGQKLKIVTALKGMGLVVGMTGDGVNDAPALKAADVGVAMGRRGTDVAREAAQIVLLDDDFSSIVAGIEEGRTIFDNLRKFTSYVLVSNVPEMLPYLLYIVLPVPLALTIVQILAIDLGTDLLPALALGREPPSPGVMRRPPRRRGQRLLSGPLLVHSYAFLGLIEAAWSLALFFLVLVLGGWRWGEALAPHDPLYRSATGVALASVVLLQVGNFVGRRAWRGSGLDAGLWRNRLIPFAISLEVTFSWAVLYWPPVADVFGTGPAPAWVYALAWLGAPLLFGADLLRKRLAWRAPLRLPAAPPHPGPA